MTYLKTLTILGFHGGYFEKVIGKRFNYSITLKEIQLRRPVSKLFGYFNYSRCALLYEYTKIRTLFAAETIANKTYLVVAVISAQNCQKKRFWLPKKVKKFGKILSKFFSGAGKAFEIDLHVALLQQQKFAFACSPCFGHLNNNNQ